MRNKDAFSGYHPTINFLYYALILLFSMCLMHPVYLAISLTGALTYDIYLKGQKAVRFAVMGLLPMAALAALVNPAFNHEGQTILTYLPSGNPLTLESMLYGVAAAVMLASGVLWFSSYNEVMTSDKFVYLFGRVIPALSLVDSAAVYFYMGKSDTALNKSVFELLMSHREEIEGQLGATLNWDRADHCKASWIGYHLRDVSITNEADWPRMAKFHAEWSDKICNAILPYLQDEDDATARLTAVAGILLSLIHI